MIIAFYRLDGMGKVNGRMSKQEIYYKVLDNLGVDDDTSGYSYNTFIDRVGPDIDVRYGLKK